MFDIIYAPFALVLRFLAVTFDNYGLALIVFALIITVIRIPFDLKGKRGTMKSALYQPQIKAIQEKYAGNMGKMNQEMQKFNREHNIKPMGGCIWMMFPMLIILLLFQIIRQPLEHLMGLDQYQINALREALENLGVYVGTGALYQVEMAGYIRPYFEQLHAVVPQIFDINMNFLGLDIGQTPNWRTLITPGSTMQEFGLVLLPVLSMIAAFVSQRVMTATNYMAQPAQQAQMMKTMMLMMPIMSLFIGFTFPAAMSLYWTVSSMTFALASVFTNMHFKKIYSGMKEEMEAAEAAKEAALEAKRKRTEELRAAGNTQENKGTSKKKKQVQEREKDRQRQAAVRAAEREADEDGEEDPSRVGHRKHARGRAYDPDRFAREDDADVDELVEEDWDDTDADDLPEDAVVVELDEIEPYEDEAEDDLEEEHYDDEDEEDTDR
ncbi:MAG: YidC/Oxa1 family membrane protein insertase [Oscillospiraceae bacterium]|nr:YidC/Oxa1 family membrane protein insertase [Oscillospiraceae bacterium]